jgi:hypothetical protein
MKFPIQHSHLAYSRNKINRMFLELDACESTREGTQGNLATYVPWVDSAAPQHQNDTLVLCCTILQIAWRMSNHCAHWYLYQFNHLNCLIIINLSNQFIKWLFFLKNCLTFSFSESKLIQSKLQFLKKTWQLRWTEINWRQYEAAREKNKWYCIL